jgi:tetratricopeptide (TPR) repeat protein
MSNSISYNERLLKIFAGVRCLNKDQLPRYLEGRLTDIEKHLVEQHLVDCDLCFEALQALHKEGQLDKYASFSAGIQQYIRDSIKPVSQLQKMERYLRRARKRESLLIYFWLVAFVVGGGSLLYLLQQYSRNKPVMARPAAVPVVPAAAITATPPASVADSQAAKNKPVTLAIGGDEGATPAVTPPPALKDTAQITPPVKKPAIDSAAKKAAAATVAKAADSLKLKKTAAKDSTPKPQVKKDTPVMAAAASTDKTDRNSNKEKEENSSNTNKPAASTPAPASSGPVDTDEYLYRAAMVYQQQGNLNEAISRYKRLTANTGRVGEMARYQMGVCYRDKGQKGKAKRMFKEVVGMDGTMKQAAQQALDNL